jgi:hypothetical protein
LGVVSRTIDKGVIPNAENLNFAVTAQALLQEGGWDFAGDGRERLQDLLRASPKTGKQAGRFPLLFPFPASELLTGGTRHGHN